MPPVTETEIVPLQVTKKHVRYMYSVPMIRDRRKVFQVAVTTKLRKVNTVLLVEIKVSDFRPFYTKLWLAMLGQATNEE